MRNLAISGALYADMLPVMQSTIFFPDSSSPSLPEISSEKPSMTYVSYKILNITVVHFQLNIQANLEGSKALFHFSFVYFPSSISHIIIPVAVARVIPTLQCPAAINTLSKFGIFPIKGSWSGVQGLNPVPS